MLLKTSATENTVKQTQENGVNKGSLEITAPLSSEHQTIFSDECQGFLSLLCEKFAGQNQVLLTAREEYQARIDAGSLPDFDPDTQEIRANDWKVSKIPNDLQDRRVEITGPTDRKMVINALNAR